MTREICWGYKGVRYRSLVLPIPCSMCGSVSVVALPEALLGEQPDDTTHVCHPVAGGCNHGFAIEAFALADERVR